MAHPQAVTAEDARRMNANDETIEFVVHPGLLPELIDWLDSLGLELRLAGPATDSTLPWYIVTPSSFEEKM